MSTLRIAWPKEDKLQAKLLKKVEEAGFRLVNGDTKDYAQLVDLDNKLPNIDILFQRSGSIAKAIKIGRVNAGFGGLDKIEEKTAALETPAARIVSKIDIGKCDFCIVGKKGLNITSVADLEGLRVVSSYPNIAKQLLEEQDIDQEVDYEEGGVEAYIAEDFADAALEIVETGGSLKTYNLENYVTLFQSSLTGIQSTTLSDELSNIFETLCRRINASQPFAEETKSAALLVFAGPPDRITAHGLHR